MILRRFTFVCLLTIVAVCGIALAPNEALSSIAGFLRSGGAGGTGPSTPSITSITPPANGTYTSGTLSFTLNWSSPVNITGGTPTLPFNTTPTQGVATCATGTNITAQVCTWSVGSNQSANPLATTASGLLLNGASIVATTGGQTASLVGAVSDTFPGIIVNPTGTPTVVTAVSITPSSGLLTQSGSIGAGNTATVTVTFSGLETVNAIAPNVPTITLSQGTVCPYASGSTTAAISFGCTILSGQDTPLNVAQVWLETAAPAIALNGGSINNGGVPATLTGANNQVFRNVQVDTTTPYFVVMGGSGSTCSWASKCLPAAAQTKAQGALKHIWVLDTGGTFTGLPTCTFPTNSGPYPTMTAYICQGNADNDEVWAQYPGTSPTWDGGCPTNAGSTPTPACVAVAFAGGTHTSGSGVSGASFHYMAFRHFYGGAFYEWYPINLLINSPTITDLYNTCGNPNAGDGSPCNGAGGAIGIFNAWTNVQLLYGDIERLAGFGTIFNAGTADITGYNMTKTVAYNKFLNICTGVSDCGGIYLGFFINAQANSLGSNVGQTIGNVVQNVGANNVCIYIDDFDSGETVTNNLCTGSMKYGIQIHGGSNNALSNNIVDYTSIAGNNANETPFYMPTSNLTGPSQTNNTLGKIIVFNGSATLSPMPFFGLYYDTAALQQPIFSALSPDWYFTAHGTNPSGFPWAGTTFGSSAGFGDSHGINLTSNPFVNASAQTSGGFQLLPGSVPLTGGFTQIPTNQGPL